MENNPWFFPSFFKYSTAFDFRSGTFRRGQHTTRIASSIILLGYTIYTFTSEGIFSFAMFHDGFMFMLFLGIELSLFLKKNELALLINFILEPVKVGQSHFKCLKYRKYVKYKALCGVVSSMFIVVFGIGWPLIPSLFHVSVYSKVQTMSTTTSNSSWVVVTTSLLTVAYMVSYVSLIQGWFVILTVTISKLKLLTSIMYDDLIHLDKTAEIQCDELLDSLVINRRLPLCRECRLRNDDVTRPVLDQLGVSVVLEYNRCRCRREFREPILQYVHTVCLNRVIVQHQNIIRLSRLVDSVYSTTAWSSCQTLILIAALLIPRLDKLRERTLVENATSVLEILSALFIVFMFSCLGELLLKQSSKIRFALYSCPWIGKPRPFRKTILLMQTVANKDLCLSAGGIYTLKLSLFLKFLETAYAYSKVLQWLKMRELLDNQN